MAWTATQEDVERWLRELREQCNGSGWQEPYKFGYRDALVAVMGKMDKDRRKEQKNGG